MNDKLNDALFKRVKQATVTASNRAVTSSSLSRLRPSLTAQSVVLGLTSSRITILSNEFETESCEQLFEDERFQVEFHQLVWCDAEVYSIMNTTLPGKGDFRKITYYANEFNGTLTNRKMERIIEWTKKFNNIEECRRYMEQTKHIDTFLVCSGSFGQNLIPQVHHLCNIESIYIFCKNVEYHKQWSSSFSKVRYDLGRMLLRH